MEIADIKKQILEWRDFHGGEVLNRDEIVMAKTREELSELLWRHKQFLERQSIDAEFHLCNFRKSLGLE